MSTLKVTLVETAPAGGWGSMTRYADLVAHALSVAGNGSIKVSRLNLAMPVGRCARLPARYRYWASLAWIWQGAGRRLAQADADIFHIMDGSQAWIAGWLRQKAVVATSHDIIPLLQAQNRFPVPPPGRMAGWLARQSIRGLRRTDRVVADSGQTRDDLTNVGGIAREKIEVIHPALPAAVVAESQRVAAIPWRERRNSSRAYVMHIGNNGFYKNRIGVLRIFERLHEVSGVRLIMAGPPPAAELLSLAKSLNLAGQIDFMVDPDDGQLGELYRHASLMLFPSLYEGFGWPPLEAMAFGCPVVCSSAGSLPEVVGDAGLLCTPDDEERMAEFCTLVLGDATLAEDLVARGYRRVAFFDAARMGEQLLRVYSQVLTDRSR
jgi:glycosyltransferase involved in cell wall biosynthesis